MPYDERFGLDYPCRIVYDGRPYTCARTLYLALAHPESVRELVEPTSGPEAAAAFSDPHDESLMRIALKEKFSDVALANLLLDSQWEFDYYDEDSFWGRDENGIGDNVAGAIMMDISEELERSREIAAKDQSYVLRHVWPGHVAPSVYGPDVMWLRIPKMEWRGTVSTIVPASDVVESKDVIPRGKRAGQHYLDVYLTQKDYPIAHHDEQGRVHTDTVARRMSREKLYASFRHDRAADAAARKSRKVRGQRRVGRANNPDMVAVVREGMWPHFAYEIRPLPDASLGLEMVMVNLDNKNRLVISVPVALDSDPCADEFTIACDPRGIEVAIECALADGAIWPAIVPGVSGSTFVRTDAHGEFAWLAFNASSDVMLAQRDEAYREYMCQGHRKVGQVRADWRDLMPVREPHGTVQECIVRLCRIASEEDPAKRREMVWHRDTLLRQTR